MVRKTYDSLEVTMIVVEDVISTSVAFIPNAPDVYEKDPFTEN